MLPRCLFRVLGIVCAVPLILTAQTPIGSPSTPRLGAAAAAPPAAAAPLTLDGGAVELDGSWQFHLGDNPAWASPAFDDSAWEQLSATKPWGAQSHPNTEGFGWYRLHVAFAPGAPGAIALMVPQVDDAYEVYWNGRPIGSFGKLPPQLNLWQNQRPGSFILGRPEPGVLAVRVWKDGFTSFDSGQQGGFESPPILGSSQAVAAAIDSWNYNWLRGQQLSFALDSLFALVGVLCFIVWFRDHQQWLVLWMAGYAFSHAIAPIFYEGILPMTSGMVGAVSTPFVSIGDISLWFLLLWLLDLHGDARLMRLVKAAAIVEMIVSVPDSFTGIGLALPNPAPWEWADGAFTVVYTAFQIIPFYLIGLALVRRSRLDWVRWMVAIMAFLTQVLFAGSLASSRAAASRIGRWATQSTPRSSRSLEAPSPLTTSAAPCCSSLSPTRFTATPRRIRVTSWRWSRNSRMRASCNKF